MLPFALWLAGKVLAAASAVFAVLDHAVRVGALVWLWNRWRGEERDDEATGVPCGSGNLRAAQSESADGRGA